MNLKEWFKTKLTPAAVKSQQTDNAKTAQLKREFDGHPSKGLTPAALASILLGAEQGDLRSQAELFMDMEKNDTHIGAELQKRKMAVKQLEWSLVPPRDATAQEKENTKRLEALMRDELDIGAIRMSALDAIGMGYSCIELAWDKTKDGLWFPREVKHRPATWFTTHPENRDELRVRSTGSVYGDELWPWGWIVHQHKSRSGYLASTGLHRALAWPYLYKSYSVRDLAEFLEIYGLPIRLGKYPAGASDTEKSTLLKAVLAIGHNAAGIIPESMQIELQSAVAQGNADSFKVMIDWADGAISKAILGGTLTSQTGANGNRSLGDVHNEVRLDIRNDDATQLDQTLSAYLVYPMAMFNGMFADNRCPSFVSDISEPDDLALYADALPKLIDKGLKVPARYVYEKLKIPQPEGDEEVLQAAAPIAQQMPSQSAPLTAALSALPPPKFTPEQQAIESLADAMLEQMKSPISSELIASAIRGAKDPQDLERRLAALMADADITEFSQTLEKCLFAADVMGYAHAG